MRVFIRTCVPNLGAVRRERFLTIYNPLNPPGVGWVILFYFFKVRVYIRAYVQHLGAVRRESFLTIDNPLNPPGVGQLCFKVKLSIRTCVPTLGAVRSDGRVEKGSLKFPNEHTHTRVRTNDMKQPPKPPWGGVGQFCLR